MAVTLNNTNVTVNMTVKELKEIAKSLGMKGYSKMRKAELISAIEDYKTVPAEEDIYNSYADVAYDPIKDYERSLQDDTTWDDEALSMPHLDDQPADTDVDTPDISKQAAMQQAQALVSKSFKQGFGKRGVIISMPEENYFGSHNKCEDIIKVLARVTHNGKSLWYKGDMYNGQYIATALNMQDAMMLIVHNTPGMKDSWSSVEKLLEFLVKKGWLTIVNKKNTYRYNTYALSKKSLDLLRAQ